MINGEEMNLKEFIEECKSNEDFSDIEIKDNTTDKIKKITKNDLLNIERSNEDD